ncbi:pyruvate/2-oxoglutarate dehydrogenase complex, dehydrogenase component beta subunit [Caldisphaera lagunensis DSM 15908]|uniref:2-oxoacid oxidoreductase (ferredoxin) n=1 Tax=Caldisphaera lagunensis (strain DSM 15908 / JCM 11604 / ANMR 0165 / IC-154) TaxID=1056495 RepID=L0AAM1_CALLD|nr:dehydrogenase E1 component subunit alpha/beta [Caldisphaera lagunensis]AFZ70085.1 pyruvate/2-oxoglutarate dehydrogenase complex, dehydrogenase component beta subunit [Caldisphaera lagunensis DSM 15908]
MVELNRDVALKMYKDMIKIRYFEDTIRKYYYEDKQPLFNIAAGPIPGEMHLAAGQEPAAVGLAIHLKNDDFVAATHRPHHIAIAKGVDLKKMAAEIFGKETGLGKGKGGHMHLFDKNASFGCSGIVGAAFPQAVGAGLAFKYLNKDNVAVAYGGDGAANQGTFHESLNLAALWKLPVIFVIEDNKYAISVPKSKSTAISRNADRAVSYGIPGVFIPDNDVFAMFEASKEAVERARSGKGPTLIEIETYRLYGHFEGDPEVYRPKDEVEKLKQKDPINRMREDLMKRKWLDEDLDGTIRSEAQKEVDEAIKFALESPYPKPEEALEDVYAYTPEIKEPEVKGNRRLPMYLAISEAISQEMERDKRVIVMGEDVGVYGGIFGATYGLYDKFGPERVIDTPISEAAFIGGALGAAMSGLRPIVELMFVDFLGVAFDQMFNHIAKDHYMSGGNINVPLVLQTAIGGGYNDAAQHSQVLYALFAHVPGFKVVVPSNSFDAKGLMISSIRDENPVVYMFHKGLMGLPWMPYPETSIAEVPEEEYEVPIGKAKIVRKGKDITIVSAALTVHRALEAANSLSKDGIEAEVIDLRTIKPLDRKTIIESVKDTKNLLVVDEDYMSFGLTGEVIASVAEESLTYVKSYRRIAVPDVPIPYSRPLEQFVQPSAKKIIETVHNMLGK